MTKPSQPSWIGYELNGRYKIQEALGEGGMSAVFKAEDPNLKRVVAIELIHPHLSKDPEFVRRFEVEAASVAQLRHANIIQVYDFDHDGDTYYMVLEFVPGESLQGLLKRYNREGRKISLDEVVKYAANTCDAVDYAHKRGMVHRDIKPANVMINVQGEAILMDFGIVKIVGEKHHTATGAVVGTALYMSPEQIRGERPDHRADIYSLGVMLYEMVSGRRPFEADSAMTIMMMHLNDPIPEITKINPNVPPSMRGILEKAMAKNPDDRYQSAHAMAADLRQALVQPSVPPAGTVIETPTSAGTVIETPSQVGTVVEQSSPAPTATYVESQAPSAPAPSQPLEPSQPAGPGMGGGPPSQASSSPEKKGFPRNLIFMGGGAILLIIICAVAGVFLIPPLLGGGIGGGNGETPADSTSTAAVAIVDATQVPEPTLIPPTATDLPPTLPPTITPTPTETPTPTATVPVGPFVFINDISIDSNGRYEVSYDVFNFEPLISSDPERQHMHFFFNNNPPETVGLRGRGDSVGGGSWVIYDTPPPFTGYGVNNRPASATQLCVLVAFSDHSITLESGNCIDLPE